MVYPILQPNKVIFIRFIQGVQSIVPQNEISTKNWPCVASGFPCSSLFFLLGLSFTPFILCLIPSPISSFHQFATLSIDFSVLTPRCFPHPLKTTTLHETTFLLEKFSFSTGRGNLNEENRGKFNELLANECA